MAKKLSPLIVIIGETASGKTALALEVAKRFNGEIIAADSRTVYKGMDIGTAKPTPQEQREVTHHLLDVVTPKEQFNVADFKQLANKAMETIASQGKVPILVGGTGLYVDAVIYDFQFRPPADPKRRAILAKLSVEELQKQLQEKGLPLPENEQNPRHLIRAIEANGMVAGRKPLRPNTLVIGLKVTQGLLKKRIEQRIERMVRAGLIDEVKQLGERYGWQTEALQAPGYKAFAEYIHGTITLDEAKQQFAKYDRSLAKRQRAWFKRNESIHWISQQRKAVDLITTFLNK